MLEDLLRRSNFDREETSFLVQGFSIGFDFRYLGPKNRRDRSENLPFCGVGDKFMLWRKVMKEVEHRRFAGPYRKIPFKYFIQSPVGLVPKGDNDARLIFHLSYDFPGGKSFNHFIPDEDCTVQYNDLDYAIRCCLRLLEQLPVDVQTLFFSKADIHSAFRVIMRRPSGWPWTVLTATHLVTGQDYFFVDNKKARWLHAELCFSLYCQISGAFVAVPKRYN